MSKLKTSLLKACQSKEQETELRQSFVAALPLRRALEKVMADKINASQNASVLKDGYDTPNWSLKQADNVGYQRAMKEILNLL